MAKRVIRSRNDAASKVRRQKAKDVESELKWYEASEYKHVRTLLNMILGYYERRGKTYDEMMRVVLDAIDSRVRRYDFGDRQKSYRRESPNQQRLFETEEGDGK